MSKRVTQHAALWWLNTYSLLCVYLLCHTVTASCVFLKQEMFFIFVWDWAGESPIVFNIWNCHFGKVKTAKIVKKNKPKSLETGKGSGRCNVLLVSSLRKKKIFFSLLYPTYSPYYFLQKTFCFQEIKGQKHLFGWWWTPSFIITK